MHTPDDGDDDDDDLSPAKLAIVRHVQQYVICLMS